MTEQAITILAIDCDTTRMVYHHLTGNGVNVSRVILEQPVSKKILIRGRIRKLGFVEVIGQLLFIILVNPFLKKSGNKRREEIKSMYKMDERMIPEEKIVRVSSVNSQECRSLLGKENTGLILVNGTRIIGKKTLESTTVPFVNVHTGITPLFRGVHGGYWAIATRRRDLFGTTIHKVDTGIDTGNVLAQITVSPTKDDNFATYPALQYAVCLPVLADIICNYLDKGFLEPVPAVVNESKLWYHPTIWGYFSHPK